VVSSQKGRIDMHAKDQTFEDTTIFLDDASLTNCMLRNCQIVFTGQIPHVLKGCRMEGCSWTFDGPAGALVEMLENFYKSGAKEMVDDLFASIRGQAPTQKYLH
jgi:hypothetical protein